MLGINAGLVLARLGEVDATRRTLLGDGPLDDLAEQVRYRRDLCQMLSIGARGGLLCTGLLGVMVMRDHAASGCAHDGMALADEMTTDAARRGTTDAALGKHRRGRHHEQRKGEQGSKAHTEILIGSMNLKYR